eukprot:7121581-Alexandrium_andersonii.AAC.1
MLRYVLVRVLLLVAPRTLLILLFVPARILGPRPVPTLVVLMLLYVLVRILGPRPVQTVNTL